MQEADLAKRSANQWESLWRIPGGLSLTIAQFLFEELNPRGFDGACYSKRSSFIQMTGENLHADRQTG